MKTVLSGMTYEQQAHRADLHIDDIGGDKVVLDIRPIKGPDVGRPCPAIEVDREELKKFARSL